MAYAPLTPTYLEQLDKQIDKYERRGIPRSLSSIFSQTLLEQPESDRFREVDDWLCNCEVQAIFDEPGRRALEREAIRQMRGVDAHLDRDALARYNPEGTYEHLLSLEQENG